MTRLEFIKKAEELNYGKDEIREILADVDELTNGASDTFDYDCLPLFEQPIGDI